MTKAPILITGCARSGTSMVCGVLSASGLDFGGPLYTKTRTYQPRGYWEHKAIRQKILKPLLVSLGADPRGQDPLPPRHLAPTERDLARIRKRFRMMLGTGEAYKDAKLLLTWQYWHLAFPNATWVLVRRDRMAIARSCLRTPFMKRRTYLAGWLAWVDEHLHRMEALRAAGARIIEVWPDANRPESFRDLIEGLGLEFNAAKVDEALVPTAWHTK
jgi:hypothetical protein